MSIENDLKRIADALVAISGALDILGEAQMQRDAAKDALSAPAFTAAASPVTPAPTKALPTTPDQLAALGAEIVGALGDAIKGPFTDFVRGQVCPLYGAKKLKEIPVDKIPAAAQQMIDWARNAAKG